MIIGVSMKTGIFCNTWCWIVPVLIFCFFVFLTLYFSFCLHFTCLLMCCCSQQYLNRSTELSHLMTQPRKWLCAQRRLGSAWASAQSDQSSLCTQWIAKDPSFLHADSEDWSDWVDAQADLSHHWAHMPFCWFCHEVAQILIAIFLKR